MLDSRLRGYKAVFFAPLTRRAGNVPPLVLTALALAFAVVSALLAGAGLALGALACWILCRAFDGLDGEAARYRNRQTDLGGYLDMMGDVISYALLLTTITAAADRPPWAALAVLFACFYVNITSWAYLSAVLEKRQAERPAKAPGITTVTMPGGLVEGAESILFVALALLLPSGVLAPLFLAFSVLVVITIAQRVLWAFRTLA